MSHPSKLIDRAKSGYQIRQHASGVYQLYYGHPGRAITADAQPIYTSHDLERVRSRRDSAIAGPKRPSGERIPERVLTERGYLRVRLGPTEAAAVASAALPGESRQDAARRLVMAGAKCAMKTDGS